MALCPGVTRAQVPAPLSLAASAPLLPFVGPNALGVGTLKRSYIEARWGPPEKVTEGYRSEKVMTLSRRGSTRKRTPLLRLRYPSLGLSVDTAPGSVDQVDPPLVYATVGSPLEGCTPQGICLGMPEEAALPLITQHYKRKGDIAMSWGTGGNVSGRTYLARNHGWRTTHRISFTFKQGRLHEMSIQLQPRPWVSLTQLRAAVDVLLGIGVVALLTVGVRAVKKSLGPIWEKARLGLGGVLLPAGAIGMVLGFASLGSGDGYAKMAALIFAFGAAGLMLFGLLVFSGASRSAASGPAKLALIGGVVLLLLTMVL